MLPLMRIVTLLAGRLLTKYGHFNLMNEFSNAPSMFRVRSYSLYFILQSFAAGGLNFTFLLLSAPTFGM
jgi:hypothetical protein